MKNFIKFIITIFLGLLLVGALLIGCAHKPNPINEINDGIQQSVKDLSDYAQNNMIMDTDKQFLLQGAKDCAARADALAKNCNVSIEKCEAEKGKLRERNNTLLAILIGLIAVIVAVNWVKIKTKVFHRG